MTTYLSIFLHLYQPPWQDIDVLKKINSECYEPLFNMMERHDNIKITINIQGCLLDMLEEVNLTNTISLIKDLYEKGKLEIVGSAKFHPILPMIPISEVSRQITLNETTLHDKLGCDKKDLRGFWPQERLQ